MELTKEHFDQVVKGLATKMKSLATKKDLRESVEQVARITSAGFARTEERFDKIETRLDFREQIKTFERKFQKLEEALHIKL